jgi:hypothetical protein
MKDFQYSRFNSKYVRVGLSVTQLWGVVNTNAGGFNIDQEIVQKGIGFMQNLQPMIENDGDGKKSKNKKFFIKNNV